MSEFRYWPSEPADLAAPEEAPAMTCGRGDHLAPDVAQIVRAQCPRCTGTGTACMLDLVYAEAFPSRSSH
jgi:hypothetical protein